MDILRKNTSPTFQIVPRLKLDENSTFTFKIVNETSRNSQDVTATIYILPNENYQIILDEFPVGKIGEKLSYKIIDDFTSEIVYLGKALIVSENEVVQDYSKKNNNKFYK